MSLKQNEEWMEVYILFINNIFNDDALLVPKY